MTGTYDIGMTSTGIPFLNCNLHNNTQASIISHRSALSLVFYISLPPCKLITVAFQLFFFSHSISVQNFLFDNDTHYSHSVFDPFCVMCS